MVVRIVAVPLISCLLFGMGIYMSPEAAFDAAMTRAEHLLRLYELTCDTRTRSVRDPWAEKFKRLMRWPIGERIVRIDGKRGESLLILREKAGIDRKHFAHDYLSELLRASVVASVSALDRLAHDLVVKHSWKLLSRREADVPKKLADLRLTAADTKRAVEHRRHDSKARPGNVVKKAIRERLHRDHTFQNAEGIKLAGQMLGIKGIFEEVAKELGGRSTPSKLRGTLNSIARRRNQIVHEADLLQTTRRDPSLRDLDFATAEAWAKWMRQFGEALAKVTKKVVTSA